MSGKEKRGLVRIRFDLEADAWHGNASERLWAEPVGAGRYRLRNSPFYSSGVSAEDVVFGEERAGELVFVAVSIAAGHSTYRIKIPYPEPALFAQYWQPLQDAGCSNEEGPVLAVDVPPTADIYRVYELLEAGADAGIWDFDEGHCGHSLERK